MKPDLKWRFLVFRPTGCWDLRSYIRLYVCPYVHYTFSQKPPIWFFWNLYEFRVKKVGNSFPISFWSYSPFTIHIVHKLSKIDFFELPWAYVTAQPLFGSSKNRFFSKFEKNWVQNILMTFMILKFINKCFSYFLQEKLQFSFIFNFLAGIWLV